MASQATPQSATTEKKPSYQRQHGRQAAGLLFGRDFYGFIQFRELRVRFRHYGLTPDHCVNEVPGFNTTGQPCRHVRQLFLRRLYHTTTGAHQQ